MQTNHYGNVDKYGVPTSFRIPADLKRQLSDEAAVRGISLAQYGASILMSSHKQAAEQSTQVDLLLRERRQLEEQVTRQKQEFEAQARRIAQLEQQARALEAQYDWLSKPDWLVLSKLQKNRTVLEQFLSAQTTTVSKEALSNAGFEPHYLTHVFTHQGKRYNCVFNVGYRVVGEHVVVAYLNPEVLC